MDTRKTVISVITAWLSIATFFAETSESYSYYVCTSNGEIVKWPDKKINWRAGKNSFSSSDWRDHLLKANSRWNQAPGDFTFGVDTWSDSSVSRGNSQNEIWFSSNQNILDGAPATCYRWAKCSGTVKWREKDIIFDSERKWSRSNNMYSKTIYGGDWRNWGATALHEMGHALGITHTNNTFNIMGSDQTHVMVNNGKIRFYAGEDGGNGEAFLYGQTDTSPRNDLGVTHWKYGEASGEYSSHWFCRMYYITGENVGSIPWLTDRRRYKVKLGGTYKAQFTFENNGYYDKSDIDVAWYISTNSNITTNDNRIRTGTMTLNRNKAYTTEHTVTIPSGGYEVGDELYLGVIVDYTGKITEFSSFNNATYLPILIVD